MIRPKISLPLPAANGTTMVTGRAGQSSAAAGASTAADAVMQLAMATIILRSGMVSSFQSAVILAALMIGHHFSISAFW
jgi:hypothetical protein